MKTQIDALKQQLFNANSKKRETEKQLTIASLKLDFPSPNVFVQEWHERKYGQENWITTLAWDTFDFGSEPFLYLLSEIKDISVELAESLTQNGFDYEIRLPYEPFKASGHTTYHVGFDYGEWEREHYEIWSSLDDDQKDVVENIICQTGLMILDEIDSILDINNVQKEDYFKFISPKDLVSGLVKIKQVDDYGIKTNLGYIYGIDFDDWENINNYRGRLIGYHQIQNPAMLPNELKHYDIFVIEV